MTLIEKTLRGQGWEDTVQYYYYGEMVWTWQRTDEAGWLVFQVGQGG